MESTAAQLIMVYNADGDKVSVLLNMAHKIVSPSTYECSLCSITHGAFTMRARWKEFLKQFPRKPRELHRDEFLAEFPDTAISFPAILVRFGNEAPRVLVTSVGLNTVSDIDELTKLVMLRLRDAEARRTKAA
ncbi:MAG: hypothetical protein A3J40_01335 [Erythrobacter sp. RIFCSPHIGHO2_12_FULL_63_10]|nr:MAG: hypothetical protein A3J40_01335 [Erythrobacter sp. RIFCSPHIGHO2_12_FULL_63_10]